MNIQHLKTLLQAICNTAMLLPTVAVAAGDEKEK